MLKVLVDMDGVLVDFLPHWLDYLADFGIDIKPEQVTRYDLSALKELFPGLKPAEIQEVVFAPFHRPGFWRDAPCLPGVDEFIANLNDMQKHGQIEWYICSTPAGSISASEKVDYIRDHFGKSTKYILTRHKYMVNADVLVDDHPENLVKFMLNRPTYQGYQGYQGLIGMDSPYWKYEAEKHFGHAAGLVACENKLSKVIDHISAMVLANEIEFDMKPRC